MKIYLSILICLLFACSVSEKKAPINIIPEILFENILKEIHLEQGSFDKHQKITNIYKKHEISEKDFTESLDYYLANPDKLEVIYKNILQQLTNEKSKLVPKETN